MRWVDVNDQLPIPQRRVLVAMHAETYQADQIFKIRKRIHYTYKKVHGRRR